MTPRKEAKPTVAMASATSPGSRPRKYGSEKGNPAALPAASSTPFGLNAMATVTTLETSTATKMASPTAACTSALSPAARALATRGTVTVGITDVAHAAVEKT